MWSELKNEKPSFFDSFFPEYYIASISPREPIRYTACSCSRCCKTFFFDTFSRYYYTAYGCSAWSELKSEKSSFFDTFAGYYNASISPRQPTRHTAASCGRCSKIKFFDIFPGIITPLSHHDNSHGIYGCFMWSELKNQVYFDTFFAGITTPLSHHNNPRGTRLLRVVDAQK